MFYSIKTYLRSEGWKGRGLYVAQRGPVPTLFGQGNHSNSARAIFACWPRLFVMLTRSSLMRVPFWMVRTVDFGFAGESPLPIVPSYRKVVVSGNSVFVCFTIVVRRNF